MKVHKTRASKPAPSPFVRKEYNLSTLHDHGLIPLFQEFQSVFETYVDSALEIYGIPHQRVPNFNRYVGDLERACLAAQTLAAQYDLGVGIAKKGTWLSFVFMLHGFRTYEALVERIRFDTRRLIMTPSFPSVEGKRVLLFDNDLHTGRTLDAVAQHLLGNGAAVVDALLIYPVSEMKQIDYKRYCRTGVFNGRPAIVGRNGMKLLVETVSQQPRSIRRVMNLSRDFSAADASALVPLAAALGVSYVPGQSYEHLVPVRVVSLDLDGTILKRKFDYALWGEEGYQGILWQYVGKQLGISPRDAYQKAAALSRQVPNGAIDIRAWISHFNLPHSDREIIDAVPVPVQTYDDFKGIVERIRQAGKRVVLATESSGYLLEKKLRDAGIASVFDAVYSSVDLFGGEKTADFFKAVCKREGIAPETLLHVGDSVTKDYQVPRGMGVHSYFISSTRGFVPASRGVPYEHQLGSLQELPRIVSGGLNA